MSVKELLKGGTAYVSPPDDNLLWYKADNERMKAENERMREALKLALNSHGRMLMSDPPQDPWKVNRVDEIIRELLQEVPR